MEDNTEAMVVSFKMLCDRKLNSSCANGVDIVAPGRTEKEE